MGAYLAEAASSRPHVLFVEPHWAVRQLFTDALELLDVTISYARDRDEALAILGSRNVEFAYISLTFDDEENGLALADQVAARGIPLVLMSGHLEGLERGLAAGYAFLQKPLHVDDLIRPLLRHLLCDRSCGAEADGGPRDHQPDPCGTARRALRVDLAGILPFFLRRPRRAAAETRGAAS